MKILFQGDSITDAGRDRGERNGISLGTGYPNLIGARMGMDAPGRYEFLNFGVGGDRSVDVYARIKRDCWNHQPDVISLLVGVNDVWHNYGANGCNGVDTERYTRVFEMLIEDTKERLPDVKFIILEPFALKGTGNEAYWEEFDQDVRDHAAAAKALAEKHGLIFVPLQQKLEAACALQPASYWLRDGVHPTAAGHQLIADAWMEAFRAAGLK